MANCERERVSDLYVDGSTSVEVPFSASEASFFAVAGDGGLSPELSATLAADGLYRVEVNHSYALSMDVELFSERFAAQGRSTRLSQVLAGTAVPRARAGFMFRLLAMGLDGDGVPVQSQSLYALPQEALARTGETLTVTTGVGEARVGSLVVEVKDAEGEAIQGASVATLRLSPSGTPFLLRENPLWGALPKLTDAQGEVVLTSIPMVEGASTFQIVADKPGYCATAIEPQGFDPLVMRWSVTLSKDCGEDALKEGLRVEFGEGALVRPEEEPLVGMEPFLLRLSTEVERWRGFSIKAVEGSNPFAEPAKTFQFGSFVSTPRLELPRTFANEDSEFRLVIDGLGNAPTILSAKRQITPPTIAAGSVKLSSEFGVAGVISGNLTIHMVVADCAGIADVALSFAEDPDSQSVAFKPCSTSSVAFSPDEAQLESGRGGNRSFAVFARDELGLLSNPATSGGVGQVYVDFGVPDLGSLSFGVDFGIALPSEAMGTNEAPYRFNKRLRLQQSAADAYVLRIASPEACQLPGSSAADGDNAALSRSLASLSLDGVAFVGCGMDLPLGETSLIQGATPTDPLALRLVARDLAGHLSPTLPLEIPACLDGEDQVHVCWSP